MKIHNEIKIAAPLDQILALVDDVPRLAGCVPGAELLEQTGLDTYRGRVKVKLGPVALSFNGVFQLSEKNNTTHQILAKAKGNEERARGSASANIIFFLREENGQTHISVDSDIQLTGAVAQYGRATSVVQGTAQAIMTQFAQNLEASLSGNTAKSDNELRIASTIAQGLWNAGRDLFKERTKKDDGVQKN